MILFYQLTAAVTITIITSNTTGNKSIQPIQSRRNKDVVNGTIIGNPDPVRDDCSPSFLPPSGMISVVGKNIGNLLNSKNIRGAGFSVGFKPSTKAPESKWICAFTNHTSFGGSNTHDYYPDVEPFQYYNSTANPHHLPPTSIRLMLIACNTF